MYNLTPDHAAFCRDRFERNRRTIVPPFTPLPVDRNVLLFPSTLGGGNWGGVSFDPGLGYLFTNVMNIGQWGHMEKRETKTGEVTWARTSEYGAYARFWNRDNRIPCSMPPFGELVAVNASTGDIAWRTPLGTVPALEAQGVKNTGALNLGGSIATAGGLVFIGATADSRFRAFESKTGRLLWEQPLESSGHAIPITYMGRDGRQYVVIMAGGGGGYFGTPLSDSLMAFALDGGAPRQVSAAPRPPRPAAKAAPAKLPDAAAKALFEKKCGAGCHTLDVVTALRKNRQEWKITVDAMAARGATGTEAELAQVTDYLARHFGR
jgi:quinoprotein glucose dehydrogenase